MPSASVPLLALALAGLASAVTDTRLETALASSTRICSAVSTTPEGRVFLYWTTYLNGTGPSLSEQLADNSTVAYPDAEWNAWNASDATQDPATHFLGIAAQRIGPDGRLWVLDSGSTDAYGPKLVAFNLTTNEPAETHLLQNITTDSTHWDDVRFNGRMAYLTDISSPALAVYDLDTGAGRRLLEDDRSTTSYFPTSAQGRMMVESSGAYNFANADQLEVSPDGAYLYYQPCNGGLWRVATSLLDAALHNDTAAAALSASVEPYAPTRSTGGTAIDAEGTVYASDTDRNAVLRVFANGTTETLVQDDRLQWVDAMWVDAAGRLWMPATQLFRGANFNNGTATWETPFYVFTLDIGVGPSLLDHA